MKLVIDIPEEVYKSIQNNDYCGISNPDMYKAIANGTPLPTDPVDRATIKEYLDSYNTGNTEQEPCEGAVSRKAAIVALDDRMSSLKNVDMQIAMGFAKGIIHELPPVTLQEPKLIPASKRLPTKEEYIANNGLFIVSDGNRTYAEYFDMYDSMKYFGEPTMSGFKIDRCVIAWMPLPGPYKAESEEVE